MITADFTFFIQLANFILLILMLNVVLYKPIRRILLERKKKVKGMQQDIEMAQNRAVEVEQTFKNKISEARNKGVGQKEGLKEAGQAEEKRIVGEINEKAQSDLQAVRGRIKKEAGEAETKLKGEVKAFSEAIAEKILGRAVS